MFKARGGGVKGCLNNVKKTALLVFDGFPYSAQALWDNWRIPSIKWPQQNPFFGQDCQYFQWLPDNS